MIANEIEITTDFPEYRNIVLYNPNNQKTGIAINIDIEAAKIMFSLFS